MAAWLLANAAVAHGAESPASVAARFAEALAVQDYTEVVQCLHGSWLYSQLDSLCADLPGVSLEARELCAKNLGARSLSEFNATPRIQFAEVWARHRWPHLFPPEPRIPPPVDPPGVWRPKCREVAQPSDKWSKLIVRTSKEVIDAPHEALVVLDVRLIESFRELVLSFAMHEEAHGVWRIVDVRIDPVAE